MTLRDDARTRILLYFLLGIAAPSGLLAYLAFRGIQNDRALVERERRLQLEHTATRIDGALEGLLEDAGQDIASSPLDSLEAIVARWPLVEAVFTVDPDGAARVVAAHGLRFQRSPADYTPVRDDSFEALLDSAVTLELRDEALARALSEYERASRLAPDAPARTRAHLGAARVERKLGRLDAAAARYQMLATEFGDVPSSNGMPPGPSAALELAGVLLQAGDTAGGSRVLLDLYADLAAGRWALTQARFDLVAGAAGAKLDSLNRAGHPPPDPAVVSDLAVRLAKERERALALLAFEERAAPLIADAARGSGRFVVNTPERAMPAVLLRPPPNSRGDGHRGFIVDLPALVETALALQLQGGEPIAWTLRSGDGEVLSGSPEGLTLEGPAIDGASVTLTPATFAPMTLEIAPLASSSGGGFLTSRRAVYFYAFVLLAGILLFGLTLSIRTVSRELQLVRMKSDFVSTVSHEFKSPLTAIRQLAEALRSGRVPSEERRREYHEVLAQQSERLSRLVDNVLDFARLEAGRAELAPRLVDPAVLVEDAVSEAGARVAHEGFTIRTELTRPLPHVRIDPAAMRQALDNLIDNGVKYSGDAREVEVRGFQEDGELVLAVRDHGVGMKPEETARVFERFYRGGDELTRAVKGTGLGLALVKRIVDAHGGRVLVASAPGEGSTFSIRLPVNGPSAPQAMERS
ncbi:MAG TPA: HAMP domain-containing sensor histidine kinase [Longimicrobiales bacterium]|nr:HAMP domain-containing sensor histidine kinase [Longimicrobiales bacterium]